MRLPAIFVFSMSKIEGYENVLIPTDFHQCNCNAIQYGMQIVQTVKRQTFLFLHALLIEVYGPF